MAFTKIAAAGIGSTGTVILENIVVTGDLNASSITGAASTENVKADSLIVSGVSTFNGNINVGSAVTIYASSGTLSATSLNIGTGVTINSGIVTATSFYGDGTNLTNTGSTLSAASGTQRVVLTGQTSGSMTATATDADLTFDASTNTLFVGGTLELGNASDTTISRVSAGRIAVEGVDVVTTSSTDTLTNKTLTSPIVTASAETLYSFGNTGTSATLALSNGSFVTATLTGNCIFVFNLTGVSSGVFSFTLVLTNDATAGRTITWPPAVKWPNGTIPVRTTTANRTDVYTFFTYDSGTTWWGSLSLYNYS
jgi:hypothetical protein